MSDRVQIQDHRRAPFAWADMAALRLLREDAEHDEDRGALLARRSIYLALCELATEQWDFRHTATAAMKLEIAARAGISERRVKTHLDRLEHLGLLVVTRRRDARGVPLSSLYALVNPGDTPRVDDPEDPPQDVTSPQEDVTSVRAANPHSSYQDVTSVRPDLPDVTSPTPRTSRPALPRAREGVEKYPRENPSPLAPQRGEPDRGPSRGRSRALGTSPRAIAAQEAAARREAELEAARRCDPVPDDLPVEELLTRLRAAVTDSTWHLWLEHLQPLGVDGRVVVLAGDPDRVGWVGDRFGRLLSACAEGAVGEGWTARVVPAEAVAA